MKKINLCLYILLLLSLTIISCTKEVTGSAKGKNQKNRSIDTVITQDRTITVYYFHTTYRCYSCTMLEKLTKEALINNFKKELKSKIINLKIVNIEENKNKHFIQDYQLFTKSVVLVDFIKGKQKKWKRLDKTWSYLRNPTVFEKYIKDEVVAFINNQP